MIIKKVIDKKEWSEFVYNHPYGNIFQTPEMYEVYQNTTKYEPVFLAAVNNENEILGTLLAVIQKEYSGVVGKFTARSIIHGGPLIKNDDPDVLDFILKEYDKIIKKKAIYSQFRNFWDWGDSKEIFIKNGFEYEEHLDILFDLKKSEDDLWKEMKGARRKGIKRSYKKGIEIRSIDLTNNKIINEAYNIIHNVYSKIKLPLPGEDFFKGAVEILDRNKYLYTIGAFLNAELIGVRFVLCYKNLIYDWYAASKDECLSSRPNDVLPWEIIKWGVNNGFDVFDFGGAGKPGIPYGVRDYKLKFGGQLVNFGRFIKVHNPLLMELGKAGLNLYRKFR